MVLMSDWISIVSIVSEILPCYPDLCYLWWVDFLTFDQEMFLANLRRFEKYRQYIGADCTRSVSLGSSFFRRLWSLISTLVTSKELGQSSHSHIGCICLHCVVSDEPMREVAYFHCLHFLSIKSSIDTAVRHYWQTFLTSFQPQQVKNELVSLFQIIKPK